MRNKFDGLTDIPKDVKDTHREKALSSKTTAPTKSINMDIWVVGTSNQLFVTGSYTEKKIKKIK